MKSIGPLPPQILFYMFNTLIKPILLYTSEIWGVYKNGRDSINNFFLKYMKRALGVKKTTSTIMVVGETGQVHPSVDCVRNVSIFFQRLSKMDKNSVSYKVFKELESLHNAGFNTWVSKALDLFGDQGLDFSINDLSQFKNHAKSHLLSKYKEDWRNELNNIERHPMMRTYTQFKQQFCMEDYLTKVSNSKYRHAITQFRTSSHNLNIEKFRHNGKKYNPPIESRTCKFCRGHIEDEFHFLMQCDLYGLERDLLFKKLCIHSVSYTHLTLPTILRV